MSAPRVAVQFALDIEELQAGDRLIEALTEIAEEGDETGE
jgi:hypothetical protein